MVEDLGEVILKSGETVHACAIRGPDDAWRGRIARLLVHKGEPWIWQNTELLTRETGIDAWFYVLHRAGTPFAHIMTAEVSGVGIFGHAWTEPADRGQGAAGALMARQMAHFRARAGRALFLNTAPDSPAYHLYRRHGFEPAEPGSGAMQFFAAGHATFAPDWFAAGEVRIEPANWRHWPAAPALLMAAIPGIVRCAPLGLFGRKSPEAELLPFIQAGAPRPESAPPPVLIATTPAGTVVGLAAWQRDALSADVICADVFCHPRFWSHGDALLAALLAAAPAARLIAYADSACAEKSAVLMRAGFRLAATWPRRLAVDAAATGFADLLMFERVPTAPRQVER
jgi:GNAT superfamily N-acetyltransferase